MWAAEGEGGRRSTAMALFRASPSTIQAKGAALWDVRFSLWRGKRKRAGGTCRAFKAAA